MQDIIMILGPPSERFFKQDSRLSIHNPTDEDRVRSTVFFNYFNLGFDICFDTSIQNPTVTKMILHGNIPGSLPFQKYRRCRWEMAGQATHSEGQVNSEMQFYSYADNYPHTDRPMILRRAFESPSSSVEMLEDANPVEDLGIADWGKADLYGSKGYVFEVMENGSVSSLTIY